MSVCAVYSAPHALLNKSGLMVAGQQINGATGSGADRDQQVIYGRFGAPEAKSRDAEDIL